MPLCLHRALFQGHTNSKTCLWSDNCVYTKDLPNINNMPAVTFPIRLVLESKTLNLKSGRLSLSSCTLYDPSFCDYKIHELVVGFQWDIIEDLKRKCKGHPQGS